MYSKFSNIVQLVYIRYIVNNPVRIADYYRKRGYEIGEGTEIFPKVNFGSEPYLISIGRNVKITNDVKFFNHDGGVHVIRNLMGVNDIDKTGTIRIGDNVFIGNNVLIMPNVTIGKNCIIGAGSIVTKSIIDNSVAAGSPCKVICTIDEYYNKNINYYDNIKNMTPDEKRIFLERKYKIEKR